MAAENENAKSRWERIKKQMRHTYRLVVMNNETFEEVGSYRLTLLNVYIFISTVLLYVHTVQAMLWEWVLQSG